MKRLDSVKNFSTMIGTSKVFSINHCMISEQEIIDLQDKFLTPGFQYLQVPTVEAGRALVNTILASLPCYEDSVIISSSSTIQLLYRDMYEELLDGGYIDSMTNQCVNVDGLCDFFLDECEPDFIWIEATKDLLNAPWYFDVEHKLSELKIDTQIPIVVVSYTEL